MTRHTPGFLSKQSSIMSLRQRSLASEPATPTPRVEPPKMATRSKNFVLADMEGRSARENRVCTSCIGKLTPREVDQVNWHLPAEQACRLCEVAECKPEAFTQPFCSFLQENPTIFHTVDYFHTKLEHLGYEEVSHRTMISCCCSPC